MSVEQDADKGQGKNPKLDPLEFLEAVANGRDPRSISTVYTVITQVDDDNFGSAPDEEQWAEIMEALRNDPSSRYKMVSLDASMNAVKTLAEYKHPKRKSIEMSVDGGKVEIPPLTEEELDLFEVWFNDQF